MQDFESRLREILSGREPNHPDVDDARDAAVLIPIVGGPEPSVILTLRTDTLPSHKGQIAFPGGSIDPTDKSAVAAALREAHEEIGLEPDRVRILGVMDPIPTYVSGYVVTPVIGWIDETPELSPNEGEVAAVLQVPIRSLAEEIRVEPGFVHGGRTFPTEAWIWDDQVIWGFTARVVREFLGHLADAGLVEPIPGEDPWLSLPIPPPQAT